MNDRTPAKLPDFGRPPVVEVAASVQFASIQGLDAAKLGALWTHFRERYPRTEQQPPLPSVTEAFGSARAPRFGISFEQAFPTPRLWFLDQSGTRVVQVQSNRLIVNWRQLDTGAEYPRYPAIREALIEAYGLLSQYLEQEGLSSIQLDQAELTYVNHIAAGERGRNRESLGRYLTCWRDPESKVLQGSPEETSVRFQYVMHSDTSPTGRLFVEVESAYRAHDSTPIYVMNLIARGAPTSPKLEGALDFLSNAHSWIVRGFTDLTTSDSHEQWERIR